MGDISPLVWEEKAEKEKLAREAAERAALPGQLARWYLFFLATNLAIFFVIPVLVVGPVMLLTSAHNAVGFLFVWALSVLFLSAVGSGLTLALLSGGFQSAPPLTRKSIFWFVPENYR